MSAAPATAASASDRARDPLGLKAPVLVLNRYYQPVRVTTARQAFELLFMGRAVALDDVYQSHDFGQWCELDVHEGCSCIGTTRGALRVPRLVVLATHSKTRRANARLTRDNVFRRDDYTCQYCGRRPGKRQLSLDHVVPKSRGGPARWDNLVTACADCNRRKGHKLPAECGMHPRNSPAEPRWSVVVCGDFDTRFAEWEPFLEAC
ncbi:MAG: HNH endonuclease [Myxococcota bacterium]